MNTQIEPEAADDTALAPEQMLALVKDQQRSVEGQMAGFVPHILLVWGIAWLGGFFTLWLIDGAKPGFSIPLAVAVPIFVVFILIGIVTSAVLGARSGRGFRGNSSDTFGGIVYGFTWFAGALAIQFFAQGLLFNGAPADLMNIYYPVAYVLFTGIMYLASAAMWRAVPMLYLGGWTILVGLVAPFFGYPNHYLFLATVGSVGLFLMAIISYAHLARLRRAVRDAGAGS